jgi:hydroxymethylbilane synthase
MNKKVIIGSRGSDLALWQAHHVQAQLKAIGIDTDITIIKTQGDQIQHLSFDKLEGKGFFTKEIEEALLAKTIDIAVHSHKDLPTTSPEGLMVAAISDREDPSELLLINKEAVDFTQKFNLKQASIVGTSSARRKSQMLSFRPDVLIEELRGNVPTRIQKLRDKKYNAILLAAAGVERLKIDLSEFHVEVLSPIEFIPSPAQGVLAIQIREDDKELFDKLQVLNSTEVALAIGIERKVLNLFDGGCQLPLGVYCKKEKGKYHVWAAKAKTWDSTPIRFYAEISEEEGNKTVEQATAIVKHLNEIRPKKVFITRDLAADSYFKNWLSRHNYTVYDQSLIETQKIPYSSIPKTDWVFFSSSNAVKYFFAQKPELAPGIKYAVIGRGTAMELKKKGINPDFTGEFLQTYKIGRSFEEVIGNASVLFPQAKDSLQSIQKELSFATKVHDLYVYATTAKQSSSIPDCDVLVFTSPSNVHAFKAQGHAVKQGQKVIAIGTATGKALESISVKDFTLPYASDEAALATAVFSL